MDLCLPPHAGGLVLPHAGGLAKPAIIRPAEARLLAPGYLPASRNERRAALAELIRSGRLTKDQAANALVVKLPPALAMLMVNQLIGFGVGGTESSYSFRARTSWSNGGAGATSHTFSGADIGTASADRLVVVTVDATLSSAPGSQSLTLAGNAMTQAVWLQTGAGSTTTGIYYLAYASGTTADIIVTTTYGTYGYAISVYALYGLASSTPITTSSTASPLSLSLNSSYGSIIIGNQVQQNDNRTWSGLTQDASGTNGNYYGSCASARATTAETPRSISVSMSPVNAQRGTAAAWT